MRPMTYKMLKDLYEAVKMGRTKGQDEVSSEISRASLDVTDTSTKGKAAAKE